MSANGFWDTVKTLFGFDKKEDDESNPVYNGTPTDKPTLKDSPTLPTINKTATDLPSTDTTRWDDTAKGGAALGAMNDAKKAVTGYGDFTFSQQGWLDEILKNIKNYGDFSYDMNGDALYQQYKDKYIQQGKMAMADTMGQAAAMTGGYGNSYAQSVGQQAYQGQLQNLNDIIPELAQMAYDKWNTGKQDLYNQYGLASSERQNEYGLYQDKYGRLMDAYGIASDDYYKGADMYHTEQNMQNAELWNQYNAKEDARRYDNDLAQQGFENEFAIVNADNSEWWKDKQFTYEQQQDALAQENWEKQFGLSERELEMKEESWDIEKKEAGYTDSTGTPYKGVTPSGVAYDNGTLDTESIKKIQEALGVTADGYWGPKSSEAAGGLSPEEAYKEFVGGGSGSNVVDDSVIDLVDPTGGQTGITSDMREKAAEFTDNESLSDWAFGLADSGAISEELAAQLIAEFSDPNEKYIVEEDENGSETNKLSFKDMVKSTLGWEVINKGGLNLWGIDHGARVKTPNGEEIELSVLRERLIGEGMTKSDATDAIKALQKSLGIATNWFFGL